MSIHNLVSYPTCISNRQRISYIVSYRPNVFYAHNRKEILYVSTRNLISYPFLYLHPVGKGSSTIDSAAAADNNNDAFDATSSSSKGPPPIMSNINNTNDLRPMSKRLRPESIDLRRISVQKNNELLLNNQINRNSVRVNSNNYSKNAMSSINENRVSARMTSKPDRSNMFAAIRNNPALKHVKYDDSNDHNDTNSSSINRMSTSSNNSSYVTANSGNSNASSISYNSNRCSAGFFDDSAVSKILARRKHLEDGDDEDSENSDDNWE